ncbi:MAG: efflux RND transporter permease subunit [Isosphaeraceae bacterium]|nr:efflux RND transporter permease subunit [Isosphaeraceae bacterium]
MNPTVFAMRRPVTTLMMVVALISGGLLAYNRMRVDIFPSLNTPKIYVFLDYIGMSPDQMEGFIVNQLELYFQYVDGIQDINTRNVQQVALCELSFFPGTDMGQAMAQVVAMSDRAMSWMPKGTLPPMIMRMDAGSVPVGYLVLESEQTSLGMMGDYAQNVIRPLVQKFVPGTVAISPFGPNMRSIVINVDPQKLLDYNITPQRIADALATGNTIIPAGNIYIKDSMPIVANNATVGSEIQRLGEIPLRLEKNVYLRDVATFSDDTDITYGYALVGGKKSVYLPIIKKDTGSTLTVVADVHKAMQTFREAVPKDVSVNFEFDESPTVVAAVESVATEGLIGAGLTGLMILLFLKDWRSVLVVVSNIPLALLGSMFGLWITGNTINIMSLGGMALAIGILVDESTVTVENVHVQMQRTENIASAVLHGSLITAVPRLLALLCILSVFIPAFIMGDPLRSLFMPLTLGVGFAMISSYVLSSTFVPILCVRLLKHMGHQDEEAGLFGRLLKGYRKSVGFFVRLRWLVVPIYLGACVLILAVVGLQVGTELFPQIDSGQFVLRFRPPPGSNFELTRQMAVKCLKEIEHEAKPENIQIAMGFVGQVAPNFGIDNMVLFMRGPDDGQLRVALRADSGIKLAEFRERLRKVLPERVIPWLVQRLEKGGLAKPEAERQAKLSTFGFEPGDIVTNVMSFGSTMPIGVRIVGTDLKMVRQYAEKIAAEMKRIPYLRDVQFVQQLDYPSIELDIDREKAGLSGATVEDVRQALVMATASTRFSNLNYWIDSKTGFDYLVQVQVPPLRIEKPEDIEILPLESVNPEVNLMIRDVAKVRTGVRPGELDRDMSQRYLTLVANVEGEDMGRASRQVAKAVEAAGAPPRGVRYETIGQLPPMLEMFKALGVGLAVAVFVIFVLLTAYFQSARLALISIGAVPGVLAGIATILYVSNTSLNIESFMGSIMCLGVSVSNSVMLVTFMDEHWKGGAKSVEAAILGAGERLRPILMTACAMTVGMVPMALALERGSQMQAPLGRAVIGGLVMSTFATLLVVPSIFAVVIGRRVHGSPSIYPDDRDSAHYDPMVFAADVDKARHAEASAHETSARQVVAHSTDDEIIAFLNRMLNEIRSKRHDMVTHHTVDDLMRPLGFARDTDSGVGPAQDEPRARPDESFDDHNRDRGSEPGAPPTRGGF